jgi:hypothetical protein
MLLAIKAQQKRSLQVTEKVKKATLFPQQQKTTTTVGIFFYHAPLTLVTTKAMMTMAMMMSTIWYSWHHGLERFSRVEDGIWGSRRKGNRREGQGGGSIRVWRRSIPSLLMRLGPEVGTDDNSDDDQYQD